MARKTKPVAMTAKRRKRKTKLYQLSRTIQTAFGPLRRNAFNRMRRDRRPHNIGIDGYW